MNADSASRTGIIIGWVLLAIGTIALLLGLKLYFNARKMATTWMEREAKVVRGWIEEGRYREATGARLTRIGYQVNVEVDYELAARRYRNPLRLHFYRTTRDVAEQALARFPRGSSLKVFVNPEKPEEIRREVGWNLRTFLGAIIIGFIGLVFLLNGIGLLVTKGGGKTIVGGQ
ncbi:MAG: DUF3592 domain-containing protein [Bryobacteraceae bacterium]|nr:DUF3592 domain-containing protein [Bryobacteraceae bacterium]